MVLPVGRNNYVGMGGRFDGAKMGRRLLTACRPDHTRDGSGKRIRVLRDTGGGRKGGGTAEA